MESEELKLKLRPDIKGRWIAALKSGSYTQGANRLSYRDSSGGLRFCCLGVLTDLAVQDGIGEWRETDVFADNDEQLGEIVDDGRIRLGWHRPDSSHSIAESAILPEEVVTWAFIIPDAPPDSDVAACRRRQYALSDARNPQVGPGPNDDDSTQLAAHNDNGLTFDQIAHIIERDL